MKTSAKSEGLLDGPFLFVVNPNSGTGAVKQFREKIKNIKSVRPFEVIESANGSHSQQLAREARDKFAAVVAVGGDGSVHEIGAELIGSSTALGIVPTGSGNGIARHLHISMHVGDAMREMLIGKFRHIDTFTANGRRGIGFVGLGFDAHVAHKFAMTKERGFSNYVKLTLDAISHYESPEITTEEGHKQSVLTIVYANINQFGNNAQINPTAIDNDGLIDVITVIPPPATAFPSLAARLFLNSFHKSKYVSQRRVSSALILNPTRAEAQMDGEPFGNPESLEIRCIPRSLRVIIP